MMKNILGAVIPIVSMVVTYYLTNKVLGPKLEGKLGDMPPQLVPMVIGMAVGGIARQLTK